MDIIKDILKAERKGREKRIKERPVVRTKGDNGRGIVKQMYELTNPADLYGDNPGLLQLEDAIRQVNKGQKDLMVITRMAKSPMYRVTIKGIDKAYSLVGGKPKVRELYNLFGRQQNNVRALNYILISMGSTFNSDIDDTRNELDSLVVQAEKETIRKNEMAEQEIPPEMKKYEAAAKKLKELDREKQPSEYYAALQEMINVARDSRKKRFEYTITAIGQEHHKEQVDNLMYQEDLFETVRYRILQMGFETELYQRQLDTNARMWKGISTLSQAVHAVGDGMKVLDDFSERITQHYIDGVRDINRITSSNHGLELTRSTNANLRQLVSEANASAYRDVEQYDG